MAMGSNSSQHKGKGRAIYRIYTKTSVRMLSDKPGLAGFWETGYTDSSTSVNGMWVFENGSLL